MVRRFSAIPNGLRLLVACLALLGQVYDFFRVTPRCTVSFNDPPASVQARVLPAGNGNQMVAITVDGTTITCPVF